MIDPPPAPLPRYPQIEIHAEYWRRFMEIETRWENTRTVTPESIEWLIVAAFQANYVLARLTQASQDRDALHVSLSSLVETWRKAAARRSGLPADSGYWAGGGSVFKDCADELSALLTREQP